ncbi:AsmA family protein [Paraburkholderia sp. LEh10]|uniref:AsmA family protein n=1 Tax=Paraburkholderia sp. LEh10 TaxID=2821353 RepID=UPI001AE10638|nr:AsmA family protein [Paraburkholderia sp. LEh10]MBP0592065.1 AsmA family protein [Paraburkholderia sp. LEh10]
MAGPYTTEASVGRMMRKVLAWFVAVPVILVAVVALFALTFDWNRARPYVNDKVSEAIGRPFAIQGDLKVAWRQPADETGWRSWLPWPHFSALHVIIGNPEWSKQKRFATLDEIDFQVKVLPLLTRDIVIPTINLVNPSVDLERLADGRNNWTFKLRSSARPSEWKLDLRDVQFNKGTIALSDQRYGIEMQAIVDTLGQPIAIGHAYREGAGTSTADVTSANTREKQPASATRTTDFAQHGNVPQYDLGWTATGTYNHSPFSGSGKVGGMLALQRTSRPVPVQADVTAGDLHIMLVGTVTDPAHLAAVDLQLTLQGTSLDHLYPLTGIALPRTPPYTTNGHLIGNFKQGAGVFRYENFAGRVGGSDLNGTLVYTQRATRPLLEGTLVSNLLQFKDLALLIGAGNEGDVSVRRSADTTLSTREFRTDRWKSVDADVKFSAYRIIKDPALPITGLYTHVVMINGVLSLEPLTFDVAGGSLASAIHLDGRTTPLKGRLSTRARHLRLKQLLPAVKRQQAAPGEINGDVVLSATGKSPAALAHSANGDVKLLITDGTLSRQLVKATGPRAATVLYKRLFGDREVHLKCAAANFTVKDGVLDSHVFALDSQDAVINAGGKINMKNETIDLRVQYAMHWSVFSLRSPLYVTGSLRDPHVGLDASELVLRGGAMVVLGLINPFAALVPLIEPSNNKLLSCHQLMTTMNEDHRMTALAGKPRKTRKLASPPRVAGVLAVEPSAPAASVVKPSASSKKPADAAGRAHAADYRGS